MTEVKKDIDVIIVGSGASGSAAAWRLSKAGLKVVCLELGRQMDPAEYPVNHVDWERQKGRMNPIASQRKGTSEYPVDDTNSPIAICNFNAVGGSTILYSAHFPRFQADDFQLNSQHGVHEDWPITFNDLKPYYELNEKHMSVAGLVGDPKYPEIEHLLPPVPLGHCGERLGAVFNQLGWHWWPSYAAIATRANNNQNACANIGPCNTGCAQASKSSVDLTYLKMAKNNGLQLIQNAAVDSVIIKDDEAVGVVYFDQDRVKRNIYAKKIILAASAIGTPRILLNTKSGASKGIANSSGLVGRNLMLHPLGYVEGVFSQQLDAYKGPQGCLLFSMEFSRVIQDKHRLGYMLQALRGDSPVDAAMSAWKRRRLKFGKLLYDKLFEYYLKRMSIAVVCEDRPSESNRVELGSEVDQFGSPGIKVHYQLGEQTKRLLKEGTSNAKKVLKLAGAGKTYAFAPVRDTGWHIMGTCKMGVNRRQSVVNQNGEAHDVKNLFVFDSSIFVSSSCVNPANTIQAVSLLLSDRLIKRMYADS